MTHVLHRSIAHGYPTAVSARAFHSRRGRQGVLSMPPGARYPVSAMASRHYRRHARPARQARIRAHQLFPSQAAERLATTWSRMRPMAWSCVLRQRRVEAIEAAQSSPTIFCRRASPAAFSHRSAELPRGQLGALGSVAGMAAPAFAPLLSETHMFRRSTNTGNAVATRA